MRRRSATLTNVDNTISGAGQIGVGQMNLVNEVAGVVDANAAGQALIVDTGSSTVANSGLIEATFGGELDINSDINNSGILLAAAGTTMQIDGTVTNSGVMETGGTMHVSGVLTGTGASQIDSGGILELGAASMANIHFANNSGTTGELMLFDTADFAGRVFGFAGDGTSSNSDLIDLRDVDFVALATDKTTYVDSGTVGTLTLYGAGNQVLASLTFDGNYDLGNFTIESDGKGGTLMIDPPVPASNLPQQNIGANTSNTNPTGSAATITR